MLNYEDWLIFGGRLVWLLEKLLFFCTSVMSSLFQPQRFTLDLHPYILCICPQMTFYLLRLLHWAPDMTVARQAEHVCVCVCKYACVSRSRTTARSHWKERVMVRPEVSVDDVWPGSCWSCSMLLFLCDPSDPALALMSNTHTHFRTPAHSQTHDPAYTHTRKDVQAYM